MNLPNKLTVMRIILIPIIIIIEVLELQFHLTFLTTTLGSSAISIGNIIMLVIFCAGSFTDYLDGHIARKRHLVTDFGKFLDPLADKLLVISTMIYLLELGRLGGWAVIIIVSRELAVTGLRLIASNKGTVIAASMWGKSKTVSQMVMVIVLLVASWPLSMLNVNNIANITGLILTIVAVSLTVISGVDYFIKNKEVLKDK
ncbi:MAG: CDP-diacylglycerol--glycerol-3-phosphate 3-phosphatidyltransferase [Bacilli bacterium]